ncbi:MAG: hypothetical protein LUQ38_07970 [Methanotrichaceae archaeon]|nr:hypothetical protein [Methanotrichaceae archaeon]
MNNGKAWRPEFDPDQIEQAAAISSEIEQKKEILKSITQTINNFVTLVGRPSLQVLENKHSIARRNLTELNVKAKNAARLATKQNHA